MPSRCARWWSTSDPRAGLPRRVGPRARKPDRLPRRLRPRRGSRSGGVRGRGRALAARRDARQSGRLARDHGPQPRHRPHPPRPHAGGEDAPARRARDDGGAGGRDDDRGRAAGAPLHVLPPLAPARGPGGADAANAGRAEDRGDRPRVPRARRDDGEAAPAGEAEDQGRRDPLPRPAGSSASRAPRRGPRRRVPDLQRGLRRPRRPGRRGDPARAGARRADARRAGGARAAGADADERRPT